MLTPIYEKQFKKDIDKSKKRGKEMIKLSAIMKLIIDNQPLPPKNKNHKLQGNYKNCWECHIEPDWLLIYQKTKTEIIFVRTGTHSDLFV